jgi:hypothetical protein
MKSHDHTFNFEETSILHKTSSAKKLNMLEMFHIQAEDSCNKRSDTQNLNVAYTGLIESIAKLRKPKPPKSPRNSTLLPPTNTPP